jgi:hypothetical protein
VSAAEDRAIRFHPLDTAWANLLAVAGLGLTGWLAACDEASRWRASLGRRG